jgi:hypothetical protein
MAVRAGGRSRSRIVVVAATLIALLVVLVLLAQLLLPGVAATRVHTRVERYGPVHSTHVSAFPAVKLLWGDADSVSVGAGTLTVTPAQIVTLLWEARTAGTLTVLAQGAVLRVSQLPGGLELSDVRMQKRGSSVLASATMTQAQLQRAMPSGFSVQPTAGGEGQIEARASGGLFGLQASIDVLVRASEGNLIAEPRGLPFGGIATVTLFSDAHLKVQSVGLRIVRQQPLTYGVSLRAILL